MTDINWNAVNAIGQLLAAFVTCTALVYSLQRDRKADLENQKTSRAVLHQTRTLGAGMRLLALSLNKDQNAHQAICELELQIKEIESDYNKNL